MRRLVIIGNSRAAGRTFAVAGAGPLTIGRDVTCDLMIDDDRMSRVHAILTWRDGALVLVDQGSSNGTFVNDVLAREQRLFDGDIIRLGGASLRFESSEDIGPARTTSRAASAARRDGDAFLGEKTAVLAGADGIVALDAGATVVRPRADGSELVGGTAAPREPKQATTCDPAAILNAAVEAAQPLAEKKGVKIGVVPMAAERLGVDGNGLYGAMVTLLAGSLTLAAAGSQLVVVLARRHAPERVEIEARLLGGAIGSRPGAARESAVEKACEGKALAAARRMVAEHKGKLVFQPDDKDDTCLFVLEFAI